MDMTLYRAVGNLNRVALGDLSTAEFYAARVDDKGIITLMPVNIVDGTTKRTETTDTAAPGPVLDGGDDDAPFDPNDV